MSSYDIAESNYKAIFDSFPKTKPTLSAQKIQLIFFYIGSYFRKFSKEEIFNNWNHHAFYWDENEHLILNLRFLSYNDFCDKKYGYDEDEIRIKKSKSYHDNIYFLYNFNTNKLAIQGYLIDSKHEKYGNNHCIEDISKFSDDDLNYILDHKMVNYDIRDQEIDDFLNDIKKEFPIHKFYNFRTYHYSHNTDIGYLTKIDCKHNERKAILYITKYSLDTESLCTKKDNKYKIEINFLRKTSDIEDHKIKFLEDSYVKEKIYNTRKSKINNLKNKNESGQKSIEQYQKTIEAAKSSIIILEQEIKDRTALIEQQTKDLKNTIINDIKLL